MGEDTSEITRFAPLLDTVINLLYPAMSQAIHIEHRIDGMTSRSVCATINITAAQGPARTRADLPQPPKGALHHIHDTALPRGHLDSRDQVAHRA
ncbi:hypothetical protein [Streptomyces cadmiisoli]|uniref:hypothetical protein n=1 Tax=Streptomyces cadmiisoli TaxID=2184053 RepID=UPI00365FB589